MESKDYLVSICVPVYGAEKYIERCAKSLFEQSYKNVEYIFVDDCSPDNSIKLLKNVVETFPKRKEKVKIIHHDRNRGVAVARNTCIEACTGTFVTFVDADDWIENDAVECLVRKQQEDDYDIVSAYTMQESSNQRTIRKQPLTNAPEQLTLELLAHKYTWGLWSRLIRTSLFRNYHINCKPGINNGEDVLIVIPLCYYSKKVATIEKPLYHYFTNPSSITHKNFSPEEVRTSFAFIKEMDVFLTDKPEKYRNSFRMAKIQEYCRLRNRAYRNRNTPPIALKP